MRLFDDDGRPSLILHHLVDLTAYHLAAAPEEGDQAGPIRLRAKFCCKQVQQTGWAAGRPGCCHSRAT
jgi:hypothetical protein